MVSIKQIYCARCVTCGKYFDVSDLREDGQCIDCGDKQAQGNGDDSEDVK